MTKGQNMSVIVNNRPCVRVLKEGIEAITLEELVSGLVSEMNHSVELLESLFFDLNVE